MRCARDPNNAAENDAAIELAKCDTVALGHARTHRELRTSKTPMPERPRV
jgi:hypothetical protein